MILVVYLGHMGVFIQQFCFSPNQILDLGAVEGC